MGFTFNCILILIFNFIHLNRRIFEVAPDNFIYKGKYLEIQMKIICLHSSTFKAEKVIKETFDVIVNLCHMSYGSDDICRMSIWMSLEP